MATMKVYRVYESKFNKEHEIEHQTQGMYFTSLRKALEHLKWLAGLYKGDYNEDKETQWLSTAQYEMNGQNVIASIDYHLVF